MFPIYRIQKFTNQDSEIWVSRFEDMPEIAEIEFPHKHNFYEILWITKGRSKQSIDFQNYKINPNTLFFISPNQLHHFEDYDNISGYCIMFTEGFLLGPIGNKNFLNELLFMNHLYRNPYMHLTKENSKDLAPFFNLLLNEFNLAKNSDIVSSLLFVILKKIQYYFQKNISVFENLQIQKYTEFVELVRKNVKRYFTSKDFSERLFISQQHLNRIVNKITGKSTGEIIHEIKIIDIKTELLYSEKSISEIAFEFEFEDLSYFTKFFKKITKLTPSEFRNQKFK